MKNISGFLGAALLAPLLLVSPAHAAGDITNFNVKNCTDERIFVCSFDKTDSLMKIPYKARGIQPKERKEFGCASLNKCKVIIGVSKRTAKKTLSSGMEAALAAGSATAAAIAGGAAIAAGAASAATITVFTITSTSAATGVASAAGLGTTAVSTTILGASTVTALTTAAIVAGVVAVAAGGSVAGLEIADGWSDGEVCNQVRKAAQKAGMKPKSFMKNGKVYQVVEQYATDRNGSPYVNADGTAVLAYAAEKGKGKCPGALNTQLLAK